MSDTKTVSEVGDVTEELLEAVWEVVQGWYRDSTIEWDEVWDRLEKGDEWDFGSNADSPAIRKIKRVIRQWRKET